jgi:TRAP-type mannitol/chloroaromatic compound transport system substrate-binding protein
MKKSIYRLGFLALVVAVGAAFSLTALDNPALAADNKIVWKIQSTWPAADFHQVNPTGLKEKIEATSGGRLKLDLMPAGAVVPAFELLEAVHKGILDAGHARPGYWSGKHPAATLFSSVAGGPFGLSAEDFINKKKWAKQVVPYRSVAHSPYDLAAEHYWAGENPYKVMKP